jgi:quinol monooxygenase YgiN
MILVVVKNPIRPNARTTSPSSSRSSPPPRARTRNICFDWYRSVDGPNMYVLVGAFEHGAGDAHVNSEHFKQATQLLPTLFSDIPEIVNVRVPGGWSRMAEVQGGATSDTDRRVAFIGAGAAPG